MKKNEVTSQEDTGFEYLGLATWRKKIGPEKFSAFLEISGLSLVHFNKLCYYTKACAPKMFERIVAAAKVVTPDILPDYETCTRAAVREAILEARHAAKNPAEAAERQTAEKFRADRAAAASTRSKEKVADNLANSRAD